MKSWYDIYKTRMNDQYFDHVKNKYYPFISKILSYTPTRYFELGCGAGNITRALCEQDKFFREHVLIDSCSKMVGLAVENNPDRRCYFKIDNILKPEYTSEPFNFSTIAHSHGVLEHFNDEDIIKICSAADRFAGIQVHYVPTAKYEKPSRGDERLLTTEEWRGILLKVKNSLGRGVIMSTIEFNDGYDLMLTLERKFK